MAIGVSKELTKIAVKEESTEGTYEAPASGSDGYVQPLDGGYEINGSKETIGRDILTSGFQKARDRVGKKAVEWTLNVEMRASGTEGAQPDYHVLMKNMMGANRNLGSRITTGSGHTTTVINVADTSDLNVGDVVVILESGAHHISPIITVTTNTSIELLVAAASAPSDSVEIATFQTYYGSNTPSDYSPLSISMWHGDEIRDTALGARPNSLTLSNWSTGQIASFDFAGSGIDFTRVDQSSPYTPSYDTGLPPLILSACLYKDGTQLDVNNFSFTIEHDNGELPSTCAESGVLSTRKVGKRRVSGSFDPYLDDTSVDLFDNFTDNTSYSIFAFAANPSTTDGEYELGSIVSFYFPNCISTSDVVADLDGIAITNVEFTSDGGEAGSEDEVFISLT